MLKLVSEVLLNRGSYLPCLAVSGCRWVLGASLGVFFAVNRCHVLQDHVLVRRFVVALIAQQQLIRQASLVTDVEGLAVALFVPSPLLLLYEGVQDGELQMWVVHFLNRQRLRLLLFLFLPAAKCVRPGVFDWSVCILALVSLVARLFLSKGGHDCL